MTKVEQKFNFKLMDDKWYSTDSEEVLLLLPVLLESNIEKVEKSLKQFHNGFGVYDSRLIEKIKTITSDKDIVAYNTITRVFLPVKEYERFLYVTGDNGKTIILDSKDIEKLKVGKI